MSTTPPRHSRFTREREPAQRPANRDTAGLAAAFTFTPAPDATGGQPTCFACAADPGDPGGPSCPRCGGTGQEPQFLH